MPERLTQALCLSLWYRALETEVGIAIPVNKDFLSNIKVMMYEVRKQRADPDLEKIMLCSAPGLDEIWLIHKSVELPE